MFKLNNNADVNGTNLRGHIDLDFNKMAELFGQPIDGDDYKVSGEWVFSDSLGNTFTVYDWKCTNLYDSNYPSVAEFRASGVNTYNVGGKVDANIFIAWLSKCLKTGKIEG